MSGAEEMRTIPFVSVIVPAYNAAATVGVQLLALQRQAAEFPFEVLVVDNGSSDTTPDIVRRSMSTWPRLRLIGAPDVSGAAHARNVGARHAVGEILAFCDADDVVEESWLAALVERAGPGKIVAGRMRVTEINDENVVRSRSRTEHDVERSHDDRVAFASSANLAIFREEYLALGGMDETFRRSHDVEFSYRARSVGYSITAAPDAVVDYRYRPTAATLATQAFKSGRVGARLRKMYPGFTDRRTTREAVRSWFWIVTRVPYLVVGSRRQLWVGNASRAAGRLVGSVRYRVWYL